ncbi:hypothetical protein [Kitasatospora sp. NPDC094015]|uniref:P-loop NTPase n=1 Tax=Kitasatospora sp. NPDC094015 TaxID=3155205 RepID=UPI00332F6B49
MADNGSESARRTDEASQIPFRERITEILKLRFGAATSVGFLKELTGGYTEALVATCDLSRTGDPAHEGKYIVKASRRTDGNRQSHAHRRFSEALPREFSEAHVPALVATETDDDLSVDLYEIAGGGLRGVHEAEVADSRYFVEACATVSGELLHAQLARGADRQMMTAWEVLQEWLGRDFLNGGRGEALREARSHAGVSADTFLLSGEVLPDPLAVAGRLGAASDGAAEVTEAILYGCCHGDLHLRNVLLDRTRGNRAAYWLIDVAWGKSAPLLYDQAYLEVAALLTMQSRYGRELSLKVLGECDDVPIEGPLELVDQPLVDVVRGIRRAVNETIWQDQARRTDSLEYQYLLARLGAALNYAAKHMSVPERVSAYRVAAWVCRLLLKTYHASTWHSLLEGWVGAVSAAEPISPSQTLDESTSWSRQELAERIRPFLAGSHNGVDRYLVVEQGVSDSAMAALLAQRWNAVIDMNSQSEKSGLAAFPRPARPEGHFSLYGLNDSAVTSSPGFVPWLMADGWESRGEVRAADFPQWRRSHLPAVNRLLDRQSRSSVNRAVDVLCLTVGQEPDERTGRVLEAIEDHYETCARLQVSSAVGGGADLALLLSELGNPQWSDSSAGKATLPGRVLHAPGEPDRTALVEVERSWIVRLSADLEVLHSQCLTDQQREESLDEFWRGRPPRWSDLEAGLDIPRETSERLLDDVKAILETNGSAIREIFHSPGAGGTTLARRVAWDLHRHHPTVLLKSYGPDTVERIDEVYRQTQRSVLVVVESADVSQSERENLHHRLKQWNTPSVVLWVTRSNRRSPHHTYALAEPMTDGEAHEFRLNYSLRARDARARAAVQKLVPGQVPDQQVSPFYFGLAAFESDFTGTLRYVESHLANLDDRRLRVVKYLALVTRYAQRGLPYSLVRRWLTGKWGDPSASNVSYQDDLLNVLGEDLRHLIVDDRRELRLLHPHVGETVLESLLAANGHPWKDGLADLSVEFISQVCGHLGPENTEGRRILQDLFIRRDKWSTRSSQSRFAELIQQIPVDEEAYRVLVELTRRCPSEPHFWNHLGRYHMHKVQYGFDKADEYLLKAIKLSHEKDSIHFHTLGTVRRESVKSRIRSYQTGSGVEAESLASIRDVYDSALWAFDKGRKLDAEDEHGYVTPVQMIADVLNQLVRISAQENYLGLVQAGGAVGEWADGQLLLAESLMERLDMELAGYHRSSYHLTCERQLDALYGGIDTLISEWRSILTSSRQHSGAALVLARAFFREEGLRLQKTAPDALRSIVALYDAAFSSEGGLNDHDARTWFHCYRALEEYDELRALERFARLRHDRPTSLESNYYLYVLRFMRWLRGDEQTHREAERYLADSRRLAKESRRQYSYEWVGKGEGGDGKPSVPRLVHFTELGERQEEPKLWQHSEKLMRVRGHIKEIDGPQSGWITVADGHLEAFFVPKDKFLRNRDINEAVDFYLGFSYEGLRAWSVAFAQSPSGTPHPRVASKSEARPAPAPAESSRDRDEFATPSVAAVRQPTTAAVPVLSAAQRHEVQEEARRDPRVAARGLVVSLLAQQEQPSKVSSLLLGKTFQDVLGLQQYKALLGGGNLRSLVERLGLHLEDTGSGQFNVLAVPPEDGVGRPDGR